MASLTTCIKKAGSALRAEDRDAILAAFNEATAGGMKPQEAAVQAVDAQLAAVRKMLADLGDKAAPEVAAEPAAAPAEPSAPANIQDVGEKIGGARKDRWKDRGLDVTDLDAMSESEGATYASKANVWKPDYEAIAEQADPVTAAMVKVVYDQLAAQPKQDTPQGRRDYVRAMQAVRKVYGAVKTPDEAKTAYQALRLELGVREAIGTGYREGFNPDAKRVLFSVYKGRSDPFVYGYNELARVRKMVQDGFPAGTAPWKRRLVIVTRGGAGATPRGVEMLVEESAALGTPMTPEQVRAGVFVVKGKVDGAKGYAATRADAEAAAAAIYERMKGAAETEEPNRPHLDKVKREGLPQRIDRDVSAEDFRERFGWRGVEFGNWAAQDERQRLLNMAYDSLSDLAQIVGVPEKALSLNGSMGLAFGARGGGKFAAHYEPGKMVINMTKLRGAGILAHEWAHALDHYLGELDRTDAYQGKARGASGWYSQDNYNGKPRKRMVQQDGKWVSQESMRLDNLRPELAALVDGVMKRLYETPIPQEEALSIARADLQRTEAMAASETDARLKKVYADGIEARRKIVADLEAGKPSERTARSSYAKEAQKLSGKSSDGYWVRPTEMFARAFESYVFDRLVAMGAQSDYLVHGVEQDRYADETRYKGNPYPTGAERAAINEAFAAMMAGIKTRETGDGNVAMFKRGDPDPTAQAAEVQQTVDRLTAQWRNAPPVVVVQGLDDSRVPQAIRDLDQRQREGGAAGDPEGFIHKGTVYIVAPAVRGADAVQRVLFHEALGHAGLRGFYGRELGTILDRMAVLQAGKVRAKAKAYGLDYDKPSERRAAAEEVLAEMAQTSPQLGWVQKAIAAVRTWLRENVPMLNAMRLSDAEVIQNWILPARRFVEGERRAQARLGGGGAPAFQRVWHGTPYRGIEKFSTDKIGTGEGAQAYGWGLYFAGRKEVADYYRKTLGGWDFAYSTPEAEAEIKKATNYADGAWLGLRAALSDADGDPKKAADVLQEVYIGKVKDPDLNSAYTLMADMLRDGRLRGEFTGQLYEVEIPEDSDMLLWDKPLSEQPEKVRAAFPQLGMPGRQEQWEEITGQNLYFQLALRLESQQAASEAMAAAGIKGIKYLDGASRNDGDGSYNYVIFDGNDTAIQSAAFSRSIPEAFAAGLTTARDLNLPAGYKVGDLFDRSGVLNWWNKTVGTPHNLAQRNPLFRRVYDSVQSFIGDVSYYATEAADLAPRILPKLETWRDITKSPLSAEDTKAISAPIFEGTLTWGRDEQGRPVKMDVLESQAEGLDAESKARELLRRGLLTEKVLKMWQGLPIDQYEANVTSRYNSQIVRAGVVWTPAELKSLFKLNDAQVGLYQEFRAATDKSLTNLAISDMLRFGGEDTAIMRRAALESGDVDTAATMLRDHLFKMAEDDPERAEVLNDTANRMIDKADKARDLMKRGYAPLSRFGQYTLDVVDPATGERLYFGMFEGTAERSMMARKMRAQFPGAQVQTGTVSEEAYKLFAGVSPETLELFGEMLGMEATGDGAADKAFQEYLKLAKSNRSAMKRLIQRKGIAGFSEDAGRVLAGFVYSNARQTASNLHMGEMTQAASDIPQGDGQLKDAAIRLVDYIKNPQEEAQGIRGLLFAQYLGGNIASAMVNATQPLMVSFPYLSQFGGVAKAAKRMAAATKDAAKRGGTGDAALDAALKAAEEDGTVSPQEVHQLQAQSMGRATLRSGDGTMAGNALAATRNGLSRTAIAWGKVFGVAEQFNRRSTFIAAYRTALDEGLGDPAKFAKKAVNDTQFVMNKGNKPRWARGAVGSVLFTFKMFSINYVEVLHRMATAGEPGSPERAAGRKAALLALGVMFLMGGADGVPFVEDVGDVIDAALQRMGYNVSTKEAREKFFAEVLGADAGRFVQKGISGLPGVPIDVSGRMGMGNLIPGTGLLLKKTDHTSDVQELFGPVGDLTKRAFTAAGQVAEGDLVKAKLTMSPTAIRNVAQGYDMATTGMYRDARGRKVIDTTGFEAAMKAIGFQPNDVARVQDATRRTQAMIGLTKMTEGEIADRWAQGIFEGDADKVQAAKDDVAAWNAKNPDTRIKIDRSQIRKRVQAMRMGKAERIEKTAPREIRETVRRELAGVQ